MKYVADGTFWYLFMKRTIEERYWPIEGLITGKNTEHRTMRWTRWLVTASM